MTPAGGSPPLTTAPTGYTVVLPPGWFRIPVRHATQPAIDELLDRALAGLSHDRAAPARRELGRRLQEAVAQARQGAALDVYLPVRPAGEVTLSCSFVVSEILQTGAVEVDPVAVLARLFTRKHTRAVALPAAAIAARLDRVLAGDGSSPGSRRVAYALPVPVDPGRWVLASFSTLGAEDPADDFAALQVELFDAIMTTFRWEAA